MFTNITMCSRHNCHAKFVVITDDVPANNTIWIMGDTLLTDAAGSYNSFKKRKGDPVSGRFQDVQTLYMENMYAIRLVSPGLYTAQQARNIPKVILNNLVDTLNVKAKVPHSLVILINDPRFWNNNDLLQFQMERIIGRFIKEIRRVIEARNLSLPPRAVNWDYPRIFLTKALPLPNNMTKPYPKGFKSNRRRYNKLIQRGEIHHNYTAINLTGFTSENDNKHFASDGTITAKGYRNLWSVISDAIHRADNQDRINLNKVKAKQFAAQAALTSQDTEHKADDDISDIESLPSDFEDNNYPNTTRYQDRHEMSKPPTKRSLINEFDGATVLSKKQRATVPETVERENYSGNNRKITGWQSQHHHKGQQGFHGRVKKAKNNWKQKPCNKL